MHARAMLHSSRIFYIRNVVLKPMQSCHACNFKKPSCPICLFVHTCPFIFVCLRALCGMSHNCNTVVHFVVSLVPWCGIAAPAIVVSKLSISRSYIWIKLKQQYSGGAGQGQGHVLVWDSHRLCLSVSSAPMRSCHY